MPLKFSQHFLDSCQTRTVNYFSKHAKLLTIIYYIRGFKGSSLLSKREVLDQSNQNQPKPSKSNIYKSHLPLNTT